MKKKKSVGIGAPPIYIREVGSKQEHRPVCECGRGGWHIAWSPKKVKGKVISINCVRRGYGTPGYGKEA